MQANYETGDERNRKGNRHCDRRAEHRRIFSSGRPTQAKVLEHAAAPAVFASIQEEIRLKHFKQCCLNISY